EEDDDDGADQNQAHAHGCRHNRCGPLELAPQPGDDDCAEPMATAEEGHLTPSVRRERDRHLRTPGLVSLDELEEEFLEAPYLPTHVPHFDTEGFRGLENRGLDSRLARHMHARRRGIGLQSRLPEPPRERLAVATDVDPQAVRGTAEELAQLARGNLVPTVEDHDVLADRLDIGKEVARQD